MSEIITSLITIIAQIIWVVLFVSINKRVIECEERSLKLLKLIMIANNRIDLAEANQKIFYEIIKRNQ